MKTLLHSLLILALSVPVSACRTQAACVRAGDDAAASRVSRTATRYVVRNYTVSTFNGISAATSARVIYTPSAGPLTVKAKIMERYADSFVLEVKGGTLKVYFTRGTQTGGNESAATVEITGQVALNSLKASSGSDISVKGTIECRNKMDVGASSGADIDVAGLKCEALAVSASSGADVDLHAVETGTAAFAVSSGADIGVSGLRADNVSMAASSGADITAKDIDVREVSVAASSGADVTLAGRSTGTLRLTASGGADINAGRVRAVNAVVSNDGRSSITCSAQNTSRKSRHAGSSGNESGTKRYRKF